LRREGAVGDRAGIGVDAGREVERDGVNVRVAGALVHRAQDRHEIVR